MKTVPEIRQALGLAVEAMKAASSAIAETRAAARTAAEPDKPAAEAKAAAASKAYDDARAEASDLADELKRAEEAETVAARSATPRQTPEGTLATVPASPKGGDEARKMAPVRRMVADMMVAHSRGQIDAEKWLILAYGEEAAAVVKATHQLTSYATGGALSLPDFAETIIEGLENMTVVRRMQPQVLSVPGALIIPRETSAPSGSWLGENTAGTPGVFGFGDIKLDPKRLVIESVISRRLLDVAARGGAAVRNLEAYVVKRLREKAAVNEDAGFLRGAGTEFAPLGIRYQALAGNVNAISGTTAAQIEADLRSLPLKLETANIVVQAGYWIMPPRTKAHLATLRDAIGARIYESIDENGTLLGYPILTTNQIPTNLGGGTETEISFVNGPSIIVGNGSDAEVRVSIEGSYQSGAEHYSLVQRNEILIHMELYADCKLERTEAMAVLTGVTY